jgi:uncharacterized membrane protein
MSDAISFLVPCTIIALISIPLMLKVVPPNKYYGLRTSRTLGSREVWFRANRFAGWALFVASGTSALTYVAAPEYASGRSLTGLVVFLAPVAVAIVASLLYARRTS